MAEQQQEDYSKLSTDDKLSHKVWKARMMGYEEVAKLFRRIDDENSPEYSPYVGLVRKFPVESNAFAQEKALEATLSFVECAASASKICTEVVSGIVSKCLNGKPKTKDLGISICLMYVEIEKQDVVLEEVLKGLAYKQPKIVAASIVILRQCLAEFGPAVFNMKVLLKAVPSMFDNSDKNVRAEAKTFAVEMFRWVGPALKAAIDGKLKPIQIKELEDEFGKLSGEGPPAPKRLLRSQQAVAAQAPPTGDSSGAEGGAVAIAPPTPAIDPFDLMEAVNLLSQMPKDFYEKIVDTKWKERKEALEAILPLAQSPKLEHGDFGELIKTLKKIITKDSNVMVVALAGNVITALAKGLRKGFSPYASASLSGIFEKFKEKKLNVVTSLREACDAIFPTTTLPNMQEDVIEALANKNPSVKAEVLLFLSRCYCQCVPAMIPKPYLKVMAPIVVQRLDDTTPGVRDAACEVLGVLLKLLGDRAMTAYVEAVDKTKMAKINEFKEKAELKAPPPGLAPPPSAPETKPAATKAAPSNEEKTEEAPVKKKPAQKKVVKKKPAADKDPPSEGAPPPTKKPSAAAEKKPPQEKTGATGGGANKSKGKGGGAVGKWEEPPDVPEPNISNEEVDEKASEVLPAGLLDRMVDANWKERLAGHEAFKEFVEGQSPDQMQSMLYVKVLARKPGWKDSNFQVMKGKLAVITVLAEKASVFGKKTASVAFPVIVDKFADMKVKGQCGETLGMMAERLTLNYTSLQVLKLAFEHKSPKVQSESIDWLSESIKQFGFLLNVKPHIDYIKKGLAATNPAVRTAAINLLGTMGMYMGAQLRMFFEGEKSSLLAQIDSALEKCGSETPPAPVRGPNVKSADDEVTEESNEVGGAVGGASMSLADLMPKVDISGQIKADIIKELGDKNWKIRGEGLQKIQEIIKTAKFIQPSLGDLPGALKGRLGDSNKNLVITTLSIIESLGVAMGSACSKFNKVFVPAIIQTMADSKPQVRAAGVSCLSGWVDQVGVVSIIEQDLISPSLATDNPNLRTELLGWLEEKLPLIGSSKSTEAQSLIHPVYICLEDRSAEVRKKAQGVLPVLMAVVGYDAMLKNSGKLKPASKQSVKALLDKHRPALPVESTPSKPKKVASDVATPPKDEPPKKGNVKVKNASETTSRTKGSKDVSEDDAPPLILVPRGKEQRMKDDEKLKLLKWNFQLPRPEHIDQLKDQMLSCVSLSLHKKLFHEDFKQQLAAVAILTKAVQNDVDAAISCSDLILRWVTLKFFDTNTTVNMKCLEFLQGFVKVLTNCSYRMSDYESSSFLPYLVIKVGDPKDPVRKAVRALCRDICSIYPPGKLFTYVLDGLKSKNARQRTECLELLGELVQNNGMTVCQPNAAKTIPLIAGQISDRDNGVRSAALNTMVIVHANIGEDMYKHTSQVS
jgi:cytoskeleton-associated protein 5